jgi:hypothetical protein
MRNVFIASVVGAAFVVGCVIGRESHQNANALIRAGFTITDPDGFPVESFDETFAPSSGRDDAAAIAPGAAFNPYTMNAADWMESQTQPAIGTDSFYAQFDGAGDPAPAR